MENHYHNEDNGPDRSDKGLWEPIKYRFKHLPIHLALLYTGKVLAFGGSGNDENHLNSPYPAEIFEPDYGDISDELKTDDDSSGSDSSHSGGTDNTRIYEIPNTSLEGDIFCSGHAFLEDGRLIVAGGTYKYDGSILKIPIPPFSGLDHSYTFHPIDLKWTRLSNMINGRWYPTCIMLSDGRILVMAGLSKQFPWVFLNKLEIYSHNDNVWNNIPGANRWIPMYPRLHLLPSGEIFYAGSYNTHYTFPFSLRGFPSATFNITNRTWTKIGNPNNLNREEGTTVLLPLIPPKYTARVLLIAGGLQPGTEAIRDVEKIDFSDEHPRYRSIEPLKHPRYYAYAVLLPDQSVLVLGGKTGTKGHMSMNNDHKNKKTKSASKMRSMESDIEIPHDPHAVLEPELFDPNVEKWLPMAPMKVDRLYHAGALLLPDGRVMTAGSNPDRRVNELRVEIYRPPYLFRGNRPLISKCPSTISYGKEFEVETGNSNQIEAVALIRASVTTHCVNNEQRYVALEYSQKNSTTLSIKVPSNRNVLPPGYYMIFIISEQTVPSIASFVMVA
jgi:galactose oxidase-like protein